MIKQNQWKAWLYLLPAIVLLLIFTGWPIVNTIRIAFMEGYDPLKELGGEKFSFGFQNFADVLRYKRFLNCLKTTMILCFTTVPLSTMLAPTAGP